MRPSDRRERTLELVLTGEGEVLELAERFEVSPSTVRRDLERLVADGRIARTYGGAVGRAGPALRSLHEREGAQRAAKAAIARRAAELLAGDGSIILDAGSSIAALAARLSARGDLTVVTNNLAAQLALAVDGGPAVIALGGELSPRSQATTGATTLAALAAHSVDRAVIGGVAVDPDRGLGAPTLDHATLKAAMAGRAEQVCVLADHTKLEHPRARYWTPLPEGWTLVTDDGADATTLSRLRESGNATVLVATRASER